MKKSNIAGMKDLISKLDKMKTSAGKLDGTKVQLNDLLSPTFMRNNTPFHSLDAWANASGIIINSWDDVDANLDKLNAFTVETTPFQSWDDMLQKAEADYIFSKMGL